MRQVRIAYHPDNGIWWADSPDMPGFYAVADTLEDVRKEATDGISIALDREAFCLTESVKSEDKPSPYDGSANDEDGSFNPVESGGKRTDGVKSWDETYMALARNLALMRSKDPHTQVGAFIVDREHRPLSMGYNGAPRGWDDSEFPWNRTSSDHLDNKYEFVVHAERNAILNCPSGTRSLEGSTLYVTKFPCNECAKEIAQSGIGRVVYDDDNPREGNEASFMILEHAGIRLDRLQTEA